MPSAIALSPAVPPSGFTTTDLVTLIALSSLSALTSTLPAVSSTVRCAVCSVPTRAFTVCLVWRNETVPPIPSPPLVLAVGAAFSPPSVPLVSSFFASASLVSSVVAAASSLVLPSLTTALSSAATTSSAFADPKRKPLIESIVPEKVPVAPLAPSSSSSSGSPPVTASAAPSISASSVACTPMPEVSWFSSRRCLVPTPSEVRSIAWAASTSVAFSTRRKLFASTRTT